MFERSRAVGWIDIHGVLFDVVEREIGLQRARVRIDARDSRQPFPLLFADALHGRDLRDLAAEDETHGV